MVRASYKPKPGIEVTDATRWERRLQLVPKVKEHVRSYASPKPSKKMETALPPFPVSQLGGTWCKGSAQLTAQVMRWEPTVALYGPGGARVVGKNPWPIMGIMSAMCRESTGVPTAVNGGGLAYNGGPACGLLQLNGCPGPQYLDGYLNIDYAYRVKYLGQGMSAW